MREREVLVPLAPEHQCRAADARVERREPRQRALVAAAHSRDVVAHREAPEALPEVRPQGTRERIACHRAHGCEYQVRVSAAEPCDGDLEMIWNVDAPHTPPPLPD